MVIKRTEKTICPRCDGQGLLDHIRLNSLNLEGYLCDECDAFWVKGEEITKETFKDFSTFLEEKKLKDNPLEVSFLD